MNEEQIKLECLSKAIQIAPNIGEETICGVTSFNGSKDPQKVLDIANLFYQWIRY